jgi:hypothetical protein
VQVACGPPPIDLDRLNFGQAGAPAEVVEKPFQCCPPSLGQALDGPVGAVADPAHQPRLSGAPEDEVAKADSLDVAVDDRMEAGLAKGSLFHPSDFPVSHKLSGVPLTVPSQDCYCFGRMAAG